MMQTTVTAPSTWQTVFDQVKTWARINSPWAIHFNSGWCNGCDIEILATLTPRYDIERFGIKLQGSPRHADVLICTGPVTRQARDRLVRVYEQMPEPKFVVAVGSCGISGGAFRGCYNVVGDISEVIPVDAYIPGCPPRPEAIIHGVVALLESLKK
jgi:NADH-quinone oxidoreductase B subunit